jgi:uncharacterized OB-fold protein
MDAKSKGPAGRSPIREGLLAGDLSNLEQVRLAGTQCSVCREVSLGQSQVCPNCGSDAVAAISLGRQGVLWSFTVVRHKPPGDYRGPEPFAPFGMGLIELPEGIRVLAPIDCDVDGLRIGMALQIHPSVRPEADGGEVVYFDFTPAESSPIHV